MHNISLLTFEHADAFDKYMKKEICQKEQVIYL